jgi:hypothetical protein
VGFGDATHASRGPRGAFQIDRKPSARGRTFGRFEFPERILHKQLLTFTWWVNKKDAGPKPVSGWMPDSTTSPCSTATNLPTEARSPADGQLDGNVRVEPLRLSIELAEHDHVYEDLACLRALSASRSDDQ